MLEQRLAEWDAMIERLKHMKKMLAASGIKIQPTHAEDTACPETQPPPSTLENLPKKQPLPKLTAPPPCADPEPITAQKKDQPPPSPPTPPRINLSKTQKNDTSWPKPKVQPPPTPSKFPPCSPIDKPRHQPPQSRATLFPISSTQKSPYLKTTRRQPQTRRAKPKKSPPPLKLYLFHTDWSRRRKHASNVQNKTFPGEKKAPCRV